MAARKGNNNVYFILAVVIIMVVIIVLLNFYSSSIVKDDTSLSAGGEIGLVEKIQVKVLDLDIFNNQKFRKLRDNNTLLPDIDEIKTGKDNPFNAD